MAASLLKVHFRILFHTWITGVASVVLIEQNPSRGYAMNWNVGVQRELTSKLVATVAYVGSKSVHLDTSANSALYALPIGKINGQWIWPKTKTQVAVPNAANVRGFYWQGFATYSSLQTQLQLKAIHGFSGQASYTLGRCISNSDSGSSIPAPLRNSLSIIFPWNDDMATGPCDFDIRSNFVTNFFYSIPSPAAGPLKWIAGGWELGGIVTASTGSAFTLLTGGDPLNMIKNQIDYPDRVAGCNPYREDYKTNGLFYLNQSCFVVAAETPDGPRFGNLGRNQLRGPGLVNVDASVLKNISLREQLKVQLRFEFFNMFNHTNFIVTNTTLGGGLGKISGTATASRQIQFGAKIIW